MLVKVKDLIEALQKENPEANVFVGCHEDYSVLYKKKDGSVVDSKGAKILKPEDLEYEDCEVIFQMTLKYT